MLLPSSGWELQSFPVFTDTLFSPSFRFRDSGEYFVLSYWYINVYIPDNWRKWAPVLMLTGPLEVKVKLLSYVWLLATSQSQLCPWDFPGKNIGVRGCSLPQGIFLTQEQNPGLPLCRQILYCLSHSGILTGPLAFLFWDVSHQVSSHLKNWVVSILLIYRSLKKCFLDSRPSSIIYI